MSLLIETLKEDRWEGDITTQFCLDEFSIPLDKILKFKIMARVSGVFSGTRVVDELKTFESFKMIDALNEGDLFEKGKAILVCEGPLKRVLSIERSLLNLLQHSCAISTQTAQLVNLVKERASQNQIPAPCVLHTRKTLPGLRDFQLEAVLAGGGQSHRRDLASSYLFKENHKYLCRQFGVTFSDFLKQMVQKIPNSQLQVEVETEAEYRECVMQGVKRVLLDNFSPERIKNLLKDKNSGMEIEVSGNISPANIQDYVLRGVDRLSLGFITHSVKALDLGLDWDGL